MGWFEKLRDAFRVDEASSTLRRPAHVVSPWADSSGLLPGLIAADILGAEYGVGVTRELALQIPAIVKGRGVIHSVIGSRPLAAFDDEGVRLPKASQPTWLYRSDTGVAPRARNKAILDDHLFEDASLLAVKRGSRSAILDAVHVPFSRWSIDSNGFILVDDMQIDADDVIYIPGPGPGLLNIARRHVIAAIETDSAWANRARNPMPGILLQEREDNGMDDDELKGYVTAVAAARRNIDNVVMGLPYSVTATVVPMSETDFFENGRNALRLDWANFLAMPASILDGSVATSTLTYSTSEGKRNEFSDYTVPYWKDPTEDALSLDNVIARGQSIAYDFTDFLTPIAPSNGPVEQD